MRAIIKYTLQDYIRTYLFIPPALIFILWTIVSYTYVPNPVFESYAISCAALYLITAWLSITSMNTEEPAQQQITILHAQNFNKVWIGKILSVLIIAAGLSMFAILYPVLIGAFNRSVTWLDCIIVFISLVLISLLSISVSVYFSQVFRSRTLGSWLMLALILVASLVKGGIETALPDVLSFLSWILPPSFMIINILGSETVTINSGLLLKWLYVMVYFSILFYIFLKVKKSKGVY